MNVIYTITIANKYVYVGQTTNYPQRVHAHIQHLMAGTHYNTFMQEQYNAQGITAITFNAVSTHETRKLMLEAERDTITFYMGTHLQVLNVKRPKRVSNNTAAIRTAYRAFINDVVPHIHGNTFEKFASRLADWRKAYAADIYPNAKTQPDTLKGLMHSLARNIGLSITFKRHMIDGRQVPVYGVAYEEWLIDAENHIENAVNRGNAPVKPRKHNERPLSHDRP